MGKLHNLRVAVWGELPETPEERKVNFSVLSTGSRMIDMFRLSFYKKLILLF